MTSASGLRIARNAAYLFVSNAVVRGLSTLAAILVARYLGAEQYGMLNVALAFSGVAAYFTDLGLADTMVREGTTPGANLSHVLSGALRLRLVFALATTVLIVVPGFFLYAGSPTLRLVLLAVVVPTIWGAAVRAVGVVYFQVIQEMQYVALINVASVLVSAGTLLLALAFKWPLAVLSVAYGLSALVGGGLGLALVRRRVPIRGGWYRQLLRGLPAFTISGFLAMLLPQLGLLLLPRVAGLAATGYFSAAYRIPALLYALTGVVAGAFYPLLFAYGAREPEQHFRLAVRQIRMMGFLGLVLAIPFSLHAQWVVGVVFGPDWVEKSGAVLAVLAWVVALQSVSYPLADALTTQGLQARRSLVLGMAAAVGAGLVWWLGGQRGAVGAAVGVVGMEFVCLVGVLMSNPRRWSLAYHVLAPVGIKLVVGLALALGLRRLVGSGVIGGMLTAGAVAGVGLALDREVRSYGGMLWRLLVRRREKRGWS